MTTYSSERYSFVGPSGEDWICRDENLGREVRIHWVAPSSSRELVRARLVALQAIRSPYLALIYDLVEHENWLGVVEENLDDAVTMSKGDPLRRLYEFCAGLAALHDQRLAHGALNNQSFREGPFGRGRLCNLAFGKSALDDPATDRKTFAEGLTAMGVDMIKDPGLHILRMAMAASTVFSAAPFRDRLAALLLRDKHRALLTWHGTNIELSASTRSARIVHPSGLGSFAVEYDGTRFFLAEVAGEVRVNNVALLVGANLPSSCVIALGNPSRPASQRYFVTFDQSHPEVS